MKPFLLLAVFSLALAFPAASATTTSSLCQEAAAR